jgi:transcriptional regulator with GAF, ATPase, and Fis domain
MELVLFSSSLFPLDQVAQSLLDEGVSVFPARVGDGARPLPAEFEEAVLIFPEWNVASCGEQTMRVRETLGGGRRLIVCAPVISPSDRKDLIECGASDVIAPRSRGPLHVAERILAEMILAGRVQPANCSAIIGATAVMRKLYEDIGLLARHHKPVMILGETGVGKELVARALHGMSGRKGSFVPVNCAALPAELVESELFGHTGSAFTGAKQPRAGMFEAADKGTIFLDEIGELPLAMQPKLLRVLEDGKVRPVGADREHAVQVRVVAATNRDLESEVNEGRFREDLYWRLETHQLRLPPLRERMADLPLLVSSFVLKFNLENGVNLRVPPGALDCLFKYNWPGNIRQLQSVVEKAAFYGDRSSGLISEAMLWNAIRPRSRSAAKYSVEFDPASDTWDDVRKRAEKSYFRALETLYRDDKAAAVERSGLSRSQYYEKVKSHKKSDDQTD